MKENVIEWFTGDDVIAVTVLPKCPSQGSLQIGLPLWHFWFYFQKRFINKIRRLPEWQQQRRRAVA